MLTGFGRAFGTESGLPLTSVGPPATTRTWSPGSPITRLTQGPSSGSWQVRFAERVGEKTMMSPRWTSRSR